MVYLKEIHLQNYRCFEELTIQLKDDYTILAGINGAGKTTVLDAIAVALGSYVSVFDGGNSISRGDARQSSFEIGSRVEHKLAFPVKIGAVYLDEEQSRIVSWSRELNGEKHRTTVVNAREMTEYARQKKEESSSEEAECTLPLFAYYGTGRLWMQKSNQSRMRNIKQWKRAHGYNDSLNVVTNIYQMLQWFESMTYIQLEEGHPVPELEAVRRAIGRCYQSADKTITKSEISYSVKEHALIMTTIRGEDIEYLPVNKLSDGEKGMIGVVADIAYRMALLNPGMLDNVLETPGVVLIDEIDMHLHAQWQRTIIRDLKATFPNIQFIVTTHSPFVITSVESNHILIVDRSGVTPQQHNVYGGFLDDVARQVLEVDARPEENIELQARFDDAMDHEDWDVAEECLDMLIDRVGENARQVVENRISLKLARI